MAWDDAQARQFVGGLADSFAAGYNPREYNRVRIADQEMALRRAHDARSQALHDMQMRTAARSEAEVQALIDAVPRGSGMQVPGRDLQLPAVDDGVQTPGAGMPGPQSQGAGRNALIQQQMRLAASRGDNATLSALRAESEVSDIKDKIRTEYEALTSLSDEDLVKDPRFRRIYNDDGKQPGAIGLSRDKKGFVIADYDGAGSTLPRTRAQINAAILAHLKTSYGNVDEGVKLGLDLDTNEYNRNRQYGADRMTAAKTAHSMNVDESRLANDNARLGLDRARLGIEQGRSNKPMLQQFIGADGQPVLLDMNRVPVDGRGMAQLPEGVKFPKQTIDAGTLLRYRSELIKAGTPPLQIEEEMARITGGESPMAALARQLAAANAAAGNKPPGTSQPSAAQNWGLRVPDAMPGTGPDAPRRTGADAAREWWNGGRPQKPLLDYVTGR